MRKKKTALKHVKAKLNKAKVKQLAKEIAKADKLAEANEAVICDSFRDLFPAPEVLKAAARAALMRVPNPITKLESTDDLIAAISELVKRRGYDDWNFQYNEFGSALQLNISAFKKVK